MTDLDEEFTSALNRARARGGLGFGVAVLSEGGPVTMSSGARLGGNVLVSPPLSVRISTGARGRGGRGSGSKVSDEHYSLLDHLAEAVPG